MYFFRFRELEKNIISAAASSGAKGGLDLAEIVKAQIEQSASPESVAMMRKSQALTSALWRVKKKMGWTVPKPATKTQTGMFLGHLYIVCCNLIFFHTFHFVST